MDYRDTTALTELELMVLNEAAEPKALPLSLLEDITNHFSSDREIGRGGFAVVYKGVLGNGTLVAVKRLLPNMYMDEKKFHGEVKCLMKARHKNIVRFLGYCADTQGNMVAYNGIFVMADKQERLLCFEYVPNGSLRDYINGKYCGHEWRKCCQIIKGICQGLNYLHENRIVHLDLKPENVLLDENMVPKITDFGLSRYFEENQTSQSMTSNLYGTLGYIAPELHSREKITMKSDIYSLGIIIIELLTGQKGYPDDVEAVLKSWCDRLEKTSRETLLEQVRVCIDIGIECGDFNPAKRPANTHKIIERLTKIEDADEVFSAVSSTAFTKLFVHPALLYFSCVPNKLIPSSMYLKNFTNDHFAFRLVETYTEETDRCFAKLPLYGIVPPKSTHTLGLTLQEREEKSIPLVLESSTFKDARLPRSGSEFKGDKFFEEIKEKGDMMQQVIVKAVATAQQEMEITSELIPHKTKILFKSSPFTTLDCEDVNLLDQWIITGHIRGYVPIWNGQTERKLDSFKVSTEKVVLVKFIVRKEWFVAGSGDGFIHVYNYKTKRQQVPSFKAHPGKLTSLAVHPSKPYLLSLSSNEMKLWEWDKGWECTQTINGKHSGYVCQVMFNPKNTNIFVTASANHIVEVWDLDSLQCKYKLSGHWDRVNCLDFFTHGDQQYLITGSSDCSAKIWDMHNNKCMHTLHASMSPVMSVLFHPNLQFLITGLEDGTVHLWSSTNFRLERIINTPVSEPGGILAWFCSKIFSTPGSEPVWGLTCSMKSKGRGSQAAASLAALLRHPASGLVPGRHSSTLSGGHGHGRKVAQTSQCPPSTRTRKPPLPARKRPAAMACDTMMDEEGNHSGDNVIDLDADNGEDVEKEISAAAKRRLTSKVWKEMEKLLIRGEWKAKCNYCHTLLAAGPRAGTNHLTIHLNSCTLRKIKTRIGKTLSQSSLLLSAQDDGTVGVDSYTFDQAYAREQLANMLVLHDYPLSMVDHVGFRRFVHALQPLFKLHTRNTYRNDIEERYNEERQKAIEYMLSCQSRVAVTTDMWTADNQKKGYMAVTAHFIDESWKLRSILLRFIYVPAPHNADVIAEQLYESLVAWNLDEKLMTVTVDNCTTNDKAIGLIVDMIGKKKLLCEGKIVHMRCCAHILNLIVKDGLDVLKSAIDNVRESVAYWIATAKRWEKFEEMAKFKKVKITRRLKLDCKTRWNSTFIMLDIALPYRAVFERAKSVDKQYVSLPSDKEWQFAMDVVDRLRLFYEITELFSGTDYVTANIFFPKICEIKMKMRQWATSSDPIIKEMAEQMIIKFDKYWKDIQGLMGIAILLDPRYKKQMLAACFAMFNGVEPSSYECMEKVDDMVASLHALIQEYELEDDAYHPAEGSVITTTKTPAIMNVFHNIVAQQAPTAAKLQGEIEQYLSDALLPYVEKFNVLDWWKVAGTRYPTLRKVARDVFAIPVTTVASESAFSTSGQVINEHRSRLTSHMLEVLMCSQDWLRNKFKDAHNGEASFWTCLQDIQEGMEDLAL